MRYWSDKTKALYNSQEELEKAEFALKEKENLEKIRKEREVARKEELATKRKESANKVEEARKAMVAAQKHYREVLEEFIKNYGSYHFSTSSFEELPTLFDFFKLL